VVKRQPTRVYTPAADTSPPNDAALRLLQTVQRVVLNLGAVLGVVCIALLLACLAFNVRPAVVISGSMSPNIPIGSITLHQPTRVSEIHVGDVVTLVRPEDGTLVTHRVIQIEPKEFGATLTLKGDANAVADPLGYDVYEVGKVLAVLPLVGYLVLAVQHHPLLVVLLLLLITALAVFPTKHLIRDPQPDPDRHRSSG
jgi:signal peptidase